MGIKKKHVQGCSCCGDQGCPCDCVLVELFDVDLGICAWFNDAEFILAKVVGQACEWEKTETAFQTIGSDPYDATINLVAIGTALTLTITITNQNDPADEAVYVMTGTAGDANCQLWWREALTTDTAEGDTICGDPLSTGGSARVSWVDCDCAWCTEFTGSVTVGLTGLAQDEAQTYTSCCMEIGGNYVLPYSGDCVWEDDFLICDDQLRMHITVEAIEETEDQATLVVTVDIYTNPGDVLQMTVGWSPTFEYPADCGSIDLGNFDVHDAISGDMDCQDPATDAPAGCNVVDPGGVTSTCEDCCHVQPDCQDECP